MLWGKNTHKILVNDGPYYPTPLHGVQTMHETDKPISQYVYSTELV